MRKQVLCFLLVIFTKLIFCQTAIIWQKTLGGTLADQLTHCEHTSDNGFILGGSSQSNISGNKTDSCRGDYDFWLIKIDSAGNIQWDRTLGGNRWDALISVSQTTDDGFILSGHSESDSSYDKLTHTRGGFDYWIVKLNASGMVIWEKSYGGLLDDTYPVVHQTYDGGYIVGGESDSNISGDKTENRIGNADYWILKLDSIGNIEWQNTIGGSDLDALEDIIQLQDSNYLLAGNSDSDISADKNENSFSHSKDFWVIKLNRSGNIIWQKTIGGDQDEYYTRIIETKNHNILLAGASNSVISGLKNESCRGIFDYWIIELDPTGNIIWQKTIGGDNQDYLNAIVEDANGNFIAGGTSASGATGDKTELSRGFQDYWVVGLSATGNLQWQKTIGGNGGDNLASIALTSNNEILYAGTSLSNISGEKTENSIGLGDFWILKNSIVTGIADIKNEMDVNYSIYPVPADNYLIIENHNSYNSLIDVCTLDGKTIKHICSNNFTERVELSGLARGCYFVNIKSNNINVCKYFVKLN